MNSFNEYFSHQNFHFVSLSLPFGFARNTVFIRGSVLVIATWICRISFRNDYIWLLLLLMRVHLNPRRLVQMWPATALFIRITLEDVYLNSLNWLLFIIIIVLNILIRRILTILLGIVRVYMLTVSLYNSQILEFFVRKIFSFKIQSKTLQA